MSEQLVVWEELAQATSNDSSALEIPIFMRDVETLDGEELYPEYGGVSIKRNIRFPIRAPFFDRLAFHLQTYVEIQQLSSILNQILAPDFLYQIVT